MRRGACAREADVLRAAMARDWSDDLKRHADACSVCRDVAGIAALFGAECEAALRDAPVPEAGQVWWRAAIRAHAEAARAARRPILWLQGIVGASAAGAAAALLGAAWPSIRRGAAAIASFVPSLDIDGAGVARLVDALQPALMWGLAALACFVITPIVVYFALSDD